MQSPKGQHYETLNNKKLTVETSDAHISSIRRKTQPQHKVQKNNTYNNALVVLSTEGILRGDSFCTHNVENLYKVS